MFPQRHPFGTSLTYGLNYPTPNHDHLVRGLECTKRVTRRDTPSVCEALVEDVNALESRIIKLNGRISSIKRKHNPDRKSLPKTSTLRCSKYEGYGLEIHQCPNGDASPMTHEDLKNYISYLREEEERTMQKLDVLKGRQERKLKGVHEKETLIENEAKEKRERDEKEKSEREEKEEGEKKEKEEREKEKKEESRKREKEEKREKEKEIREHYKLSMKKVTNFPLIVLLPMDELSIKEQWHRQWKEERILREDFFIKQQGNQQWEDEMMIEKYTSLEIYAHELACLPIFNKPMGDQSHTYNWVVCLAISFSFL